MKGYLTVKEAAFKFGYSERWISKLCQDNRIPGVEKAGITYLIPENAEMPKDNRITTGKYRNWKKRYGKNKILEYEMDA
ncbi:MAG: helix-turn-helix domain-containing protein [Eubacterium sp.]|nr:helix-turn-helix domain-containing protein [Eubacterium sp.]